MKQLKNTWTTFTAFQEWKISGSRLTKKVNKPSRRCLFATRKKLSTLVWKTTTLTMTSTHLKQQVLTCLQKSSKKRFLIKIPLSLTHVTIMSTT
ncbi:Uncharacterised protein [Streptococcus pneumoniae]|nr:Uncharacterised protein [Streptococcus pneumoniae]